MNDVLLSCVGENNKHMTLVNYSPKFNDLQEIS